MSCAARATWIRVPRTDAEIDATVRGICLHYIRIGLRFRHEPVRFPGEMGQRRDAIRRRIAELRSLGPGPVEPVQTCGGEWSVPETSWSPRALRRAA